ncbi:MAG: hypothetical protein HQ592_17510 [Planctomycetes bacterium]|nr:hypothetical protein [Planctomycetota bacterium]
MAELEFVPMSIGQILDQTFKLYRKNLARFIAIIAVVQVPASLITILALVGVGIATAAFVASEQGEAIMTPSASFGLLLVAFGGLFLSMVAATLGHAALTKSISECYLGRESTVGQSYRFVLAKLPAILAAGVLVVLLTFMGLALCIVPGILLMALFYLTTPAIILEDLGAIKGMSRSRSLTAGNFGKVLGLALIVLLIVFVVSIFFQLIGGVISFIAVPNNEFAAQLIVQVFSLFAQVIAAPIGGISSILLYYDLRIRKEAFDLEMLAERIESGGEESDAVDPAF